MTRDSPSQRKYTRHPDDRHEDAMTPTDNPFKALELTQLIADLKIVVSPVLYTDEGFARVAEALYDRGVRSRLHAPYRDGERLVHFTWDPALEGFEITEPGVYELRMEAVDVPDIEPFPATESPWVLCRLVKKVGVRPVLPSATALPAPGVPKPLFERPLPEGVYNVIHFLQFLEPVVDWKTTAHDGQGRRRTLTREDLRAVLAEIPDVAPRYPTIWAYEQACRTIRERDQRIADALTVLSQRPADPEDCIKVIRDAHETLRLRMPRTLPVEQRELSEATRAIELVRQAHPNTPVEGWVNAAVTLADEVEHLRTLGDTLVGDLEKTADDLEKAKIWGNRAAAGLAVAEDAIGRASELKDTELDRFAQEMIDALLSEGAPVCGICSALEPPVKRVAVGRSGRGWPRCAVHLVEDALDDAGLEKTVKRCSSCSHLASAHYEDGSGCSVTIRDVTDGHDNHCPCTFDARAEAWGTDNA